MKQYYIYITTNLINGKQYIGQHHGELNDSYLGSGSVLKKAIQLYGKENFKKEIIEICDNFEELNISEKKWIKYYNAVEDDHFYNIAEGGFNSNPCAGLSKEADIERRRKMSIASTGKRNHFYGQHFCGKDSPMYGKHHTEEAKQKMREKKIGGKAPTAKGVDIYTLNGEYIRSFETQKDFKIFLGLSPNGGTTTLKKYIEQQKPYHGYIVKYTANKNN